MELSNDDKTLILEGSKTSVDAALLQIRMNLIELESL
jgi:hypothetical protein